jgi:hypothetical protein
MHALHAAPARPISTRMFPVKQLPEPDTLIKINLLDFDPDLRRRFVQIVKARRLLS